MKKLTLSLVAVGLTVSSLGAYAALPTGASPFQIVVPNLKGGVEFTLEGLYVQPTNPNSPFANSSSSNNNLNFNNLYIVKPDYNFGFGVGLGYVFPNSGNDVQAKWTHFNHGTTNSYATNSGTVPPSISHLNVES
jgi:hypothetical protein